MDGTCKECNKTFSLERNLRKHMINVHKIAPEQLSFDENVKMYKCQECGTSYRINQDLIYHLETVHEVLIEREELTFANETDFINWKNKIEKQDSCIYICFEKDTKIEEDPGISKYICNKTGNDHKELRNRKQCHDSYKPNLACISNIKTIQDPNGDIFVARVKTHYGHEIKNQPGRKPKTGRSLLLKNRKQEISATTVSNNPEIMESDDIESQIDTKINLKNSIQTKLDILFLNIDTLNYQKLGTLNSCLDSVCHELDLSTESVKNDDIFGQIIISNNSDLDHNYL